MAVFKAFGRGVEVNGETVLSVVAGSSIAELALDILAKNGIKNPRAGQWYSQQNWLNAFKAISEQVGPELLYSIGYKIPENAIFPDDIDTIQKALASIDIAYHMNHRNGEIGHYACEFDGKKGGRMVCENPYPCDFDRGIIEAVARRFKPKSSLFAEVEHVQDGPCRKKGDESCIYTISW